MPGHEDVVTEWRGYALLWRSQCALAEWQSLVELVAVRPVWSRHDVRDLHLKLSPEALWEPGAFSWSWARVDKLLSIAQLPPRCRIMFTLNRQQGFSYQEIADIMKTPVGTVMSRLHRGRRLLRGLLGDYARERGFTATGSTK